MSAFAAHVDDNQQFTSTGVVGTLGTADTSGTAQALPIAVDPSTGAQYVNVIAGSINIGTVAEELTISGGTLNVLPQISVGTLPTVTLADYGTTVNIVTPTGFEGGTVSVGTAAVELTFTGVTKSVLITADHNNGTMVYIGSSGVAQTGANAIIRLNPGEAWSADLNDAAAALYAVAGTTAQKVYKAALT